MKKCKSLLIIGHAPSDNTRSMVKALSEGANDPAIEQVECRVKSPFDCDASHVLASDALILFTTENFGYMSGALKDLFERIYYPCLENPKLNEAKPFVLIIRAGLDGTGTDIAVHKIASGLKWREVQPTLLCKGTFESAFNSQCRELAMTVAASLENDLI